MSVTANIPADADLFGKELSELQENVRVRSDYILGKLLYVDDYSSAFGPGMDSGNYMVLHIDVPGVEGVTLKAGCNELSTLDSDGVVIVRIADKNAQTLKVVASKDGYEDVTREFRLNGLTVETE